MAHGSETNKYNYETVSVREKVSLRDLDVRLLQKELREEGVYFRK